MNEIAAVKKLKDGDMSAFEHLYRHYWTKVHDFTRLYITSVTDAEDVVHEVFMKLWDVRAFLEEEKSIEGFLFIVTRNIIFNRTRKSFNENFYKVTALEAYSESYSIEEEIEASDLREYIECLISQLPPRCQEVFRLSREQNLTYKEIAEQLSLSEKTVEHHISHALKFLKEKLPYCVFFIVLLELNILSDIEQASSGHVSSQTLLN